MPKFRKKFVLTERFGRWDRDWIVVGRHGAIQLHISEPPGPEYEHSGGVECHYRQPPDYMRDDAPSHERCSVFDGGSPCWHDGSSLQATERYLPVWLAAPNDHDRIFRMLEAEYARRFAFACEPV